MPSCPPSLNKEVRLVIYAFSRTNKDRKLKLKCRFVFSRKRELSGPSRAPTIEGPKGNWAEAFSLSAAGSAQLLLAIPCIPVNGNSPQKYKVLWSQLDATNQTNQSPLRYLAASNIERRT
jgi:hypothetical protein